MVTTQRRPLIFITVYLLGALAATVILNWGELDDRVLFELTYLSILVLLPYGILPSLEWMLTSMGMNARLLEAGPIPGPVNFTAGLLLLFSYSACLVLPVAGSRTNNERTFRILFLTFAALIAVNVHGCSLMA